MPVVLFYVNVLHRPLSKAKFLEPEPVGPDEMRSPSEVLRQSLRTCCNRRVQRAGYCLIVDGRSSA
jgi:hypothetical protein